jgi:hypothetical protein
MSGLPPVEGSRTVHSLPSFNKRKQPADQEVDVKPEIDKKPKIEVDEEGKVLEGDRSEDEVEIRDPSTGRWTRSLPVRTTPAINHHTRAGVPTPASSSEYSR